MYRQEVHQERMKYIEKRKERREELKKRLSSVKNTPNKQKIDMKSKLKLNLFEKTLDSPSGSEMTPSPMKLVEGNEERLNSTIEQKSDRYRMRESPAEIYSTEIQS